MKILPGQSGPMAFWTEVSEVEGIVEALEKLLGQQPMAVGTNAADSGAQLVWKALRRAGLREYFSAVYTAQELGSSKPNPRFFRQIESVMAKPARQMVMIGDQYEVDILGAKNAAWKAIWYNPGFQEAPGATPLHDAEIADMRELPEMVQNLNLPDYPTCLAWLVGKGTPYNILAHVNLVAAVAYLLATWLRRKGVTINPILVHRGGMLHDLAKWESLRLHDKNADHAAMAKVLLEQLGQPDLAEIADRHMPFQQADDPRRPITWEQKLVHFADKLCEGTRLVPLDERVAALVGRYPQFAAELEISLPGLQNLQAEICAHLQIAPDQMIEKLHDALHFF